MAIHLPVLSNQVLEAFSERQIVDFLDGTLGLGGHAALILEAHPEIKRYVGLDQDSQALELAKENLKPYLSKLETHQQNFREAKEMLSQELFDGILLDIGVSSLQLDTSERGFSFMREGPLDMRMNKSAPLTAKEIVNHWPEKKLGLIFKEFGEERRWRQAAKAICEARRKQKIQTTTELVQILKPHLRSVPKIHPVTRCFQALRIAVNQELEVLEKALPGLFSMLNSGGRLLVISFHSLEDRIVKEYFRALAKEGKGLILTKKPLIADRQEMNVNPRARSAKLRVIERVL